MSIKSRIKEIKEIFSIFDDSMDKYSQIIDFGKNNCFVQSKQNGM